MTAFGFTMRRPSRQDIILGIGIAVGVGALLVGWCSTRDRGWQVTQIKPSQHASQFQVYQNAFMRGDRRFDVLAITFDRRDVALRIVDPVERSDAPLAKLLSDNQQGVAINGGYFNAAFAPIGLLRVDGIDKSSAKHLSAVILTDAAGMLTVTRANDASVASAPSAIQCGPFLIDPGGTPGIRTDNAHAAERTVIATDGQTVCIISTTPVTLADLADCLRDQPPAFGLHQVDLAANLDGGPSSGCLIGTTQSHLGHEPRGRIRNALVFTPTAKQ